MGYAQKRRKLEPLLYIQSPKTPVGQINLQDQFRIRIVPEYEVWESKNSSKEYGREMEEKKEEALKEKGTGIPERKRGEETPFFGEPEGLAKEKSKFPDQHHEDSGQASGNHEEKVLEIPASETGNQNAQLDPQQEIGVEVSLAEDNIREIQRAEQNMLPSQEETSGEEVERQEIQGDSEEEMPEEMEKRKELKNLIRRLAVFPRVLERPYCEAIINGEKRIVQILSKRGNSVRVKYRNNRIETYDIGDFDDLQILMEDNG